MDILTEKGQQSLRYEDKMLGVIKEKYNVDIIETDKDSPALCDGFMVRHGIITGVLKVSVEMRQFRILRNGVLGWLHTRKLMV